MSRLQMDNLIGATRQEPACSARKDADRITPPSEAFDEHLRRAKTKAARDDSSRPEPADRAAEGPSKPQPDAKATAGDNDTEPRDVPAEPADKDPAERASTTSDEPGNGATAEQDVSNEDDRDAEAVDAAAAVVNVAAEAVAPAVVEEPALEVAAATEPAGGEKNNDAAVTKDVTEISPEDLPPKLSDEDGAEPLSASSETDAVAPIKTEPQAGALPQEAPAANTNTPFATDPRQAAAPADEEAVSRPADAPIAQNRTKDDGLAADEAGETAPAQVAPTGVAKSNAVPAAGVAEEKATAKTTETEAVKQVAEPGLPAGHSDPAGSTRPASGGPSISGTVPAATADGADAVDRAQFVDRVAGAFRAASHGDGTVRMRLHPPELGSLRLEVSVRDGAMTARLETDTPEARSVLLDHLPALRDRLAQQDIKIERFEVSYQNGSGGTPTGAEDQTASRDGSPRHAPRGAGAEPEDPRPPRSARAAQPGAGLQLDVTV